MAEPPRPLVAGPMAETPATGEVAGASGEAAAPRRPLEPAAPGPDDDDHQLLARVAEGDREAFAALYRRFHRPLVAYLLRLTGRLDAAEELVDDVLLVVWRKAASFRGHSRPSSWIFGIAYRKALKRLERRRRRPPGEPLAAAPPPVDGATPAGRWDRRERAAAVAAALAELPPAQRSVVVLTFYRGLSYPEIAERLDCPVGTVKSRMFHARRKLARALPELGFDDAGGEPT